MDYNFLSNVQSCHIEIPQLLYYSHIPSMLVALLLSFVVFFKNRTLISKILVSISIIFAGWIILNLIAWLAVDSAKLMFAWSLFGILYVALFSYCFYFLYVFIKKKDVNIIYKISLLVLSLPAFIFATTKYNVNIFNYDTCVILPENYYSIYLHGFGLIMSIIMVIFSISNYIIEKNKDNKTQIILVNLGLIFFLFSFFTTEFLAEKLMDWGLVTNFSTEFYGLFGMAVFMAFLAYLIVKFKAFDIKLLGAQALVWALVILVGSQFLFVQVTINKVLTGITLVISAVVGLIIVRSVKKEIALREQLEIANNNQEALIHFISHQIKGFFTKSKMIFSGLLEGDFGEVDQEVKDVAKLGLDSDNNAVAMVQDILGASNLKTGTTNYNFKLVDLTKIVQKVADNFKPEMEKKGLKLETDISIVPLPSMVDETQITQVFKNLLDNSLRYTPAGEIKVSLQPNPADKRKALFIIKDTGVGLSEKDKAKLFTEGGKGEESMKVNTNSTGYGLYIVRKIVESHKGRIWAESAGRGHGSKFCVELQITA